MKEEMEWVKEMNEVMVEEAQMGQQKWRTAAENNVSVNLLMLMVLNFLF